MNNKYILIYQTEQGLRDPIYYQHFTEMVNFVTEQIRNSLIENEATYKQVIQYDNDIKDENEWSDNYHANCFVIIDNIRQNIKAVTTAEAGYFDLQFIGEKLPD